jgi:hypothetical protein
MDEALDGSIFCYGNNLCSKKQFVTSVSPPKVPAPEETEDVGPTTIGEYPK